MLTLRLNRKWEMIGLVIPGTESEEDPLKADPWTYEFAIL